ncbi:phosphoribosylformylglycinamidine synthase II, partial [Ancylomarina salipaludis]
GLLVAVAEMAMASGTGAVLLASPERVPAHGWWFGEDQARYVVAVADGAAFLARAAAAGVPARHLGRTGGQELTLAGVFSISVERLRAANAAWLPGLMKA